MQKSNMKTNPIFNTLESNLSAILFSVNVLLLRITH